MIVIIDYVLWWPDLFGIIFVIILGAVVAQQANTAAPLLNISMICTRTTIEEQNFSWDFLKLFSHLLHSLIHFILFHFHRYLPWSYLFNFRFPIKTISLIRFYCLFSFFQSFLTELHFDLHYLITARHLVLKILPCILQMLPKLAYFSLGYIQTSAQNTCLMPTHYGICRSVWLTKIISFYIRLSHMIQNILYIF